MFGKSRGAQSAWRLAKAGGSNRPGRGTPAPASRYRIPVFELLELRELLTGNTFTPSASVADSASAADNNLRSAIAAVNADASGSGSDTIQLGSGTYTLALGELQIINTQQTITIEGQGSTGPNATIIDQTALDRVFQINAGVTVIFENLEITGGTATNDGAGSTLNAEGGGILNHGNLTLTNVAVIGNEALNSGASVTSGAASGSPGSAEGGGIYSDGSLTIQSTTPGASLIENNSATSAAATAGANFGAGASGGGIYSGYTSSYYGSTGQFQITGTTIAGNTAQAGTGTFTAGAAGGDGGNATGGGADLLGGAGDLLSDDTIEGNQAIGGAGGAGDSGENGGQGGIGDGGGVAFAGPAGYIFYGPFYPVVADDTFVSLSDASGSSGAAFSDDTFWGNTAQGGAGGAAGTGTSGGAGGAGQGGAISTYAPGNAISIYGYAGYAYALATLDLSNDTLYRNNALGGNGFVAGNATGGGIDNFLGRLSISSTTITANTAQAGTPTAGGTSGTATGGGIENDYYPEAIAELILPPPPPIGFVSDGVVSINSFVPSDDLTIDNTLDAGNTAATAPDFYGAATSTDHNLIGDGTDATGFSAADGDQVGTSASPIAPRLGPLQNNGGSNLTLAPLFGSPALGAGDPAAAISAGLSTDQRGLPRVVDGAVDVGAFETQQPDGLEISTTDSQGGSSLNAATGTATPGTAITYTIVVSNSGPTAVPGASIVDTLPSSLTGATYTAVASGGALGFTASGTGSIDDTAVNLPVGSTITYTVQATIASSAIGTLTNTATVTPLATVAGILPATATDTDTLTPQSNLQIAATDNRGGWGEFNENGTVAPGQSITYTISVSNTGPSDAVGASIVDALPAALTGATFTAVATGGASGFTASGTGSIDDTDVDLPGYSTITYTVQATVGPTATGTVAITTNVTPPAASGGNPNSLSTTDTDNIVVPSGLQITETDNAGGSSITGANGNIVAGNSVTYTVVVSSLGPGDQSGVAVSVPLSYALTGATFTATATGGATGFSASGTGNVNDSGIDMPAGSTITYTVTASAPVEVSNYIYDTAYVTYPSTASESYDENDYAFESDMVTQPPHLEITNSTASSAVPGQATTYTVTVTNPTASALTGASVVDPLAATLTGATYTATQTGGASGFAASGSGSIDDTDVDMPAGSSITYTVQATIASSATGTLSSTATVTALPGATVNASLVTGLDDPQGIAVSGDDLFVVNTATGTVGEYTTAGAVVNAALITGLADPEGIAISGGDIFVTSAGSSTYKGTGTIGEYTLAGAVVNAALVTGLNAPVGITASDDDLFVANEYQGTIGEYTTSGTVVNASLVTGCYYPVGIAVTGGDLFVADTYGEIGEYDATTGATINASLVVTGSSGIAASGGDLFFTRSDGTIGELTPSGTIVDPAVVTGLGNPQGIVVSGGNIFVTLPASTPGGTGAIAEYAVGNDSASATNTETLTPQSNVTITKTDNLGGSSVTGAAGTATPGQAITYTIVVSNTGPSDAVGESVVDPLPSTLAGATFTATATGGASGFTASGTGNIDDTNLDLPAGSTITYTVQATVSQAASDTLSNTATLTEPATALVSSSFVTGLGSANALVVSGGDLFVADGDTIGQYNATTGATINPSLVTGLDDPAGIAVSGGDLFVANYFAGMIGEYDATTGATINASFVSGLSYPSAIAVSGGDLFVTDNYSGTIGEYDATTGATINASLVSGLSGMSGLAVSGGDLFVASAFSGLIDYDDPDGTISEYNATTGATINASLITGLTTPGDIAVSGGNLYVASDGSIGEYTLSGATINAALIAGSGGPFALSGSNVIAAHFDPQLVTAADDVVIIGEPIFFPSTPAIYEYATVTASATDTDDIGIAPAFTLNPTQTVDLSANYNLTGIANNGAKFTGGLDGQGNALSESTVGTSQTWNGVGFSIAPAGTNNVVQAAGQTIALPSGSFANIDLLATGVNGNQASQTFTINYTDGSSTTFTQSISDWHMPQGYAGETVVLSTPYRNMAGGGRDNAGPFDVYGYSFAVDSTKTVASITLPSDPDVEILAITAVAPVAAPTNLTVTAASGSEDDLSWSAAAGAITGYNVYRGTTAGGESSTPLNSSPLPASATSYADTTALPGNTYFYVVRAINAPLAGPASSEVSVTTPASGAAIPVDLAGDYNLLGITAAGAHFAGGLDGDGNTLNAATLGTTVAWNGTTFNIAPAGSNNVIQAVGQTVGLPEGSDSQVELLATGVNGNQANQSFTIHYTDGTSTTVTQSISDWHMPQNYAGEAIAVSTSARNASTGGTDSHGPFDVYGYSIPVDNTKTIASITLPNDKNVDVLAITAVS
ncbi:MAG TPA: choice-of-anchor Q domain-containing protein [Pirellulales bacterium]|jgi:uncharacterized repeat protein (TIGR01451 family)|nr:choice-of-anchor Q domain-containing protein [Pirellulales bacterium]